LIAVGARPRALVLVASSSFYAINRFSVSSYGSEDVALRRLGGTDVAESVRFCSGGAARLLGSQAIWAQKPLGILRMPYLDIPHRVNLHNFAYREFVTLSAPKGKEGDL
jgi:hypothetical protein